MKLSVMILHGGMAMNPRPRLLHHVSLRVWRVVRPGGQSAKYDSCTCNILPSIVNTCKAASICICFPTPYFLHAMLGRPSGRISREKPLSNSRGFVSPGSAGKTCDPSCTGLQAACEIGRHHTVCALHQSHLHILNMSFHVTCGFLEHLGFLSFRHSRNQERQFNKIKI